MFEIPAINLAANQFYVQVLLLFLETAAIWWTLFIFLPLGRGWITWIVSFIIAFFVLNPIILPFVLGWLN